MDNGEDQPIDVRSVVEAVSADHSFGTPLYVVESMCMRCGENVSLPLPLTYTQFLLCILKKASCFFLQGTTRFLLTLIPNFRKVPCHCELTIFQISIIDLVMHSICTFLYIVLTEKLTCLNYFFLQILLSAFECPHCGERYNF